MARSIAVFSAESKTGNTTVAVNLGLALHQAGKNVLVIDADLLHPNISEHLDIRHLPVDVTDAFDGKEYIRNCTYKHPSGLKVLPTPAVSTDQAKEYYEKIQHHLKDLQADYEYLLYDMPRNAGVYDVLDLVEEGVIVHSPEFSSKQIIDVKNAFRRNRVLNLGIVLNKSHRDSIQRFYDTPVIATVPDHPHIAKSFASKTPLLAAFKSGSAIQPFKVLAQKLID